MVHFSKRYTFVYSIKTISNIFLICFILISAGITLSISSYLNRALRSQIYQNAVDNMILYNSQVAEEVGNLENYLLELSSFNTDMSLINSSSDKATLYASVIRIQSLLKNSLTIFDSFNGIFYYSPYADQFIYAINQSTTYGCATYARTLLRSHKEDLYHGAIDYASWQLYLDGTEAYFIRFMICGNAVAGIWTAIPTMTDTFETVFGEGSYVFYTDKDGCLINAGQFESFQADAGSALLGTYQIYTLPKSSKYLAATVSPDYYDGNMVAFLPLSRISHSMMPIYRRLGLIAVMLLLIYIVISFLYGKLISTPIRSIKAMISAAQSGESPRYQAGDSFRCKEVVQTNTAFQNLISEIQNLKIDNYEKKLAAAQLELLYLKSQVSPHFLINCLSIITSLSMNPQNEDSQLVLQKMSQTLSEHLRYTLSSHSCVSLGRELHYTANYLELSALRYPNCLEYTIDVPAELQNAASFPMMLLMLTENSIKHNMVMGEHLSVAIQARYFIRNGKKWIHIWHLDSGSGYPEETLSQLKSVIRHPEICRDGYHIGIYNIVKSLNLIYGPDAVVSFSNDPNAGARIDFEIPYITFTEEKA